MAPVARTELAPEATCRACGKPLPPGKSACPACGAAHGEANRCPHCRAIADVERHAALGFRCLVCGGPRVALDVAHVTPSARTQRALEAAGQEQTKHVMFSAVGFLMTGMGALALIIGTIVVLAASPGVLPTLATYLAASVPFVAGLLSLARAASARTARGEALRTAHVSALADVQAVSGALDAARAAELLRISPERAELLLAEASVATLLDEVPAPRLRIEGPAPRLQPAATVLDEAATEPIEPRGNTVRGDTEI